MKLIQKKSSPKMSKLVLGVKLLILASFTAQQKPTFFYIQPNESIQKSELILQKCDKPDSKKKPEGRRGVSWTTDTVDNEHMNKKKSKSCCIYVKPKKFGESDTESSEDECPDHCGPHRKKQ